MFKAFNLIIFFCLGCSKDSFTSVFHAIRLIVNYALQREELFYSSLHHIHKPKTKQSVKHQLDEIFTFNGETLLLATQRLLTVLDVNQFGLLMDFLIESGSDVNAINEQDDRSLLTYSVWQGDRCVQITRKLLNCGAVVWPDYFSLNGDGESSEGSSNSYGDELVDRLTKERNRSAFTWFLKGLMARTNGQDRVKTVFPVVTTTPIPEDMTDTMVVLCHAMAENPARMRRHVNRVMMHLGQSIRAQGPLFNEVRAYLAPFWKEPQPLKYLCLKRIRNVLGPRGALSCDEDKLAESLLDQVPGSILKYLRLN